MVTSDLIESLHKTSRVSQIQKLSVSWCAFGNNIKFSAALSKLISDCGRDLQVLRIQGCMFTLDEVLLQVATNCERISELNLSSSVNITDSYICISQLNSLTRLDLYRSSIDDNSLTEIIQANPHLEHLNVGNVTTIQNFDLVASALEKKLQKIEIPEPVESKKSHFRGCGIHFTKLLPSRRIRYRMVLSYSSTK